MSQITSTNSVKLENLVTGWDSIAEAHRAALREGWGLAHGLVQLHREAVAEYSRSVGAQPTKRQQATLLVATHAHNVFVALLGHLLRGEFDTASYLMRAPMESWILLTAVSHDDELAERYMRGQLGTQQAWKAIKDAFIAAGRRDEVKEVSALFDGEWTVVGKLSHASAMHGDKLLRRGGASLQPVLGGHRDDEQLFTGCRAAFLQQRRLIGALRDPIGTCLSESWDERFRQVDELFNQWMRERELGNPKVEE